MTDSAQLLIDLVTAAGFPAEIATGAARLVVAATNGDTDALKVSIGSAHPSVLAGWTYTLAYAVSIGTRRPAAPGTTYTVTLSGTCPSCGVTVTNWGSGIAAYPDVRLGDSVDLRCICGGEVFPGVVVGVSIDPFETRVPDPDEED